MGATQAACITSNCGVSSLAALLHSSFEPLTAANNDITTIHCIIHAVIHMNVIVVQHAANNTATTPTTFTTATKQQRLLLHVRVVLCRRIVIHTTHHMLLL